MTVSLTSQTIYSADSQLTTASGSSNTVQVLQGQPTGIVQISINADALTTSATKVQIDGRANSGANWVVLKKADNSTEASVTASSGAAVSVEFPIQLMPFMRVTHSGTYAATVGNNIRVYLVAPTAAVRADS